MNSPGDIDNWLADRGFEQFIELFNENEIDLEALKDLTESHLKELGLSLGVRIKLNRAILDFRNALGLREDLDASASIPVKTGTDELFDAENRQLTVMFCDLVGSTELSVRLGAEDFRDIILAYQEACSGVINYFNGFVARFFGDGILVYFGYPHAHENDVELAVRAALEVVKAVSLLSGKLDSAHEIELSVRVGLATGPAVVGDIIGEGASQQSTALGETPNLAARIQELARPNSVVISAQTHAMLAELYTYEYLGEHQLKGIVEPVEAWIVEHEGSTESRFQATRSQQLTPLVGRLEELEILSRRWQRAINGEAQIALITGEAGIGKSRIAEALIEKSDKASCYILRYQCSPNHQGSALYPIINHLQRAAGFARDDSAADKLAKLEQKLLGLSDHSDTHLALLANLLSISAGDRFALLKLTPQQQKDQTLAALNRQIFAMAEKKPVLIIFEDIHWIDPTSLESMNYMISRIQGKQILTVFTYRPEFQPPWTGEANVCLVAINKLSQQQSRGVINRITSGKTLPDQVCSQIISKTDGVPLFVEELTKTVLDSGLLREEADHYALDGPLPAQVIPSTLQDSLMARLDRMGSAARELAQVGAVIGREFSEELIQAVIEQDEADLKRSLDRLIESELLIRRGTSPRAYYIFKHALIQDTAYASLLKNQRQKLHAIIAATLEQQMPLVVDSNPELVAFHHSEAGQTETAVKFWQLAGRQANQRSANAEASRHLSTALTELESLPVSSSLDQIKLEILVESITPVIAVRGYAGPELEGVYRQALTLCERVGDTPQIYPALYARWVGMLTTGRLPLAKQYAYELLEFAEKRNAKEATILAWRCLGTVLVMLGDPLNSYDYFNRVIEALESRGADEGRIIYGQDVLTATHFYSAYGACTMGRFEDGLEHAASAIQQAEKLNHAQTLGACFGMLSFLYCGLRDEKLLKSLAQKLDSIVQEHDLALWACASNMTGGVIALLEKDFVNANQLLLDTVEMFDSFNFMYLRPVVLCFLAESYLEQNQFDQAMKSINQGLNEITLGRDSWYEPELHRIKARTLKRMGAEPDNIEESIRKAISVAQNQSAKMFESRAICDMNDLLNQS